MCPTLVRPCQRLRSLQRLGFLVGDTRNNATHAPVLPFGASACNLNCQAVPCRNVIVCYDTETQTVARSHSGLTWVADPQQITWSAHQFFVCRNVTCATLPRRAWQPRCRAVPLRCRGLSPCAGGPSRRASSGGNALEAAWGSGAGSRRRLLDDWGSSHGWGGGWGGGWGSGGGSGASNGSWAGGDGHCSDPSWCWGFCAGAPPARPLSQLPAPAAMQASLRHLFGISLTPLH